MTVAAVAMVRDEADIIGQVVGHMLAHVDIVIVADNLSTDGTRPILDTLAAAHPDRLFVLDDPEPGYYQSDKTTALAHLARAELGATWVLPFDADELWTPHPDLFPDTEHVMIADAFGVVPDGFDVIEADCYHHVPTGDLDTPGTAIDRFPYRYTEPGPRKVAVRAADDVTIVQGNHGAISDRPLRHHPPLFVIHHYPYRSPVQYVRKMRNGAAAYAAAPDLPVGMGGHWRDWGVRSDDDIIDRFWAYYVPDPANDPTVTYDPPRIEQP